MSIKLERPLVCLDIESTGTDPEEDHIVELALVTLQPDHSQETKCRRLNPGMPIPVVATQVHGIKTSDVQDEPTFRQVAKSLYKMLINCDLVGYNAKRFDVPMLSKEFERCGLVWPQPDQLVVDPFLIFKRQEGHTLSKALEFYTGVVDVEFHAAEADAEAALMVLLSQSIKYIGDERTTLKDLAVLERNPDWIDKEGKAKWIGDIPVINFGKHAGKPLNQIETDYIEWVLKQDFPDDFKGICRDALQGNWPRRKQC